MYSTEINDVIHRLSIQRSYLHELKGIVGTGITHSDITGIGYGPHLEVYIEKDDANLKNEILRLMGGEPVNIVVVGFVRPLINLNLNLNHPVDSYVDPTGTCSQSGGGTFMSRYRPLQIGAGIENATAFRSLGYCGVGTLGCFATDNYGRTVMLSNNHVIAFDHPWKRIGNIGDAIINPGGLDGGDDVTDRIGTLEKWVPIQSTGNIVDCAYGIIDNNIQIADPGLCNYSIGHTIAPTIGMNVKKSGRTTGCTNAYIAALDVSINVGYDPTSTTSGVANFTRQIRISSTGFISGGDSGSVLVANNDNNNALGLIFAGGGDSAFANVMSDVERMLGITLVNINNNNSCWVKYGDNCIVPSGNKGIAMIAGSVLILYWMMN